MQPWNKDPNATCGDWFPKMVPSKNHTSHYSCLVYSCFLESGMLCDSLLTNEIWQKWHHVTWKPMYKKPCIFFLGLLEHSLLGCSPLEPSCHRVRGPSCMERTYAGAPVDNSSWAPRQLQLPALWVSLRGLSPTEPSKHQPQLPSDCNRTRQSKWILPTESC